MLITSSLDQLFPVSTGINRRADGHVADIKTVPREYGD